MTLQRQVLEQANLLEEKFKNTAQAVPHFSVSCQHYSFAVNAFVDVIRKFDAYKYDFTLRETQTYEIIDDVANLKSEVGILYLSSKNTEVLTKLIRSANLVFRELFTAKPHVFELEDYPFLSYEQGEYNSFYFSEELTSTMDRRKNIRVRDRATLFNLVIGLNGYTVCSGVISHELNGPGIISKPLLIDEYMKLGTLTHKGMTLSRYGEAYLQALQNHIPKE